MSVIVCTHNRAGYLARALDSLGRQTLGRAGFEVLVVDNASADGTASVARERASGNWRYIFEGELGLSAARNRGLREARGAIAAFMDDDAVAAPDWCARIVETFSELGEDVAAVGGAVDPIWEAAPPPWLSPKMKRSLTVIDWGDERRALRGGEWLAGTNVAYRRAVVVRAGGFATELGRKGSTLRSCEENHLHEILGRMGFRLFYDSKLRVGHRHHIPPQRLTKRWHLRRQYWQGVSRKILERKGTPAPRTGPADDLKSGCRLLAEIWRAPARPRWKRFDAELNAMRWLGERVCEWRLAR